MYKISFIFILIFLGFSNSVKAQNQEPKTIRDFFTILPSKYFRLEGCEPKRDRNCNKARAEYIKNYLEVEDSANGYWKSGCDGGQSCLEMALFKRPNGKFIVGVHTLFESDESNYFLDYKNGKWVDVSAQLVSNFSKNNIYELPRYGTKIQVYRKKFPEPTFSERGEKLYVLVWKNGAFIK